MGSEGGGGGGIVGRGEGGGIGGGGGNGGDGGIWGGGGSTRWHLAFWIPSLQNISAALAEICGQNC